MASILPVLTLGDFIFEGFEEPYEVVFGKEQAAYKHILIGGGRIIDLMGAGDPDITWSGYFTGFQAPLRARFLETLCNEGKSLTLRTNAFVKEVVITKFTFGQHEIWPIQYTITVQVIQDKTLPINFQVPGDLTITILEYLFQAETIAALINEGGLTGALGLAIQAAEAASPFDSAANEAISLALSSAQNVVSVANTLIGTTETAIFGSAPRSGTNLSAGIAPLRPVGLLDPSALINQAVLLKKLDELYQVRNLMNGYVIKNILLVGKSDQARVETFVNPNLYRVAVQFYGNVDYWTVIAKANHLTDTKINGTISLLIPPKPSVDSQGILNP
jgi:hypothetical protein